MSKSSPVAGGRSRRAVAAAIVLGALGFGALVALLAVAGPAGDRPGRPGNVPAGTRGGLADADDRGQRAAPPPPVLLVRRIGELPGPVLRRARSLAGPRRVSVGLAGRVALRRSGTAAGRVVDAPRSGFGIPLELGAVDPPTYARLLPRPVRRHLRGLDGREVLLTRTSARLRRLGPGGRIELAGGRSLRVAGIVPDELVRRAEIVVNAEEGSRLGARRRWALVPYAGDPSALAAALRGVGGRGLRVRDLGRAPWPRFLEILPQATLKERFGEFAVRLDRSQGVAVDPAWVGRHIVSASVPILGTVRCHREMIRALRRALEALERRGLARLVDRGDYAGCYAEKDIPTTGAISRHAWGLAIDLNAAANPYGARSTQDRRLVATMERHGFAWGGRWPTPDAMHFEYTGGGAAGGG